MSTEQERRAQPESLRARFMGVSLTVKDIEQSLHWYSEIVGFHVEQKFERNGKLGTVALQAGDVRILINQDDGAKGWDRTKGEGFSITFFSTQNIDAIAQRVKDAGGTLESQPADMPWGARIFKLRDPDGYSLVISSVPAGR